jgi:hypothetical protein
MRCAEAEFKTAKKLRRARKNTGRIQEGCRKNTGRTQERLRISLTNKLTAGESSRSLYVMRCAEAEFKTAKKLRRARKDVGRTKEYSGPH